MKNLNKVFAMLLVVVMTLTSVVFADFSDVAADNAYAEAVNVGAALGLFTGYEDGTFKPEGDITRAEFAAIVVRALNQEAQAASAATAPSDFTDVADNHWAKGYINIVSRMGIVNGHGDGTFGPEENVLFEQAVKMLVVALGYGPAIGTAGYPVGYLTKGAEIGLTDGVVGGSNGVAANRGVCAQLLLNALDTPLMKQVGFNAWASYEIRDGKNDTDRETLLVDNLGIVKLAVTVNSSSITATSSNKNEDEYVVVDLRKNYSDRYTDDIFTWSKKDEEYKPTRILVGETDLSGLVGANAIVYAEYNPNIDDYATAVYAAKDTTKTYEMSVSSDMREAVTVIKDADSKIVNYEFEYWADLADRKPEYITISKDAAVYVNGVKTTSAVDTVLNAYYGEATFQSLGKDDSVDYDTIFVSDYKTYVVDKNNATRSRLTFKNVKTSLLYDPEDKTVAATLYDENGNEMDFADLVEFDVISVKEATSGSKKIIEAYKLDSTVEGSIDSLTGTGADLEATIGGKKYEVADANVLKGAQLGDEGVFFLDTLGNIAYFDATATLNSNYAYVVKIASVASGLEDKTALKLFTFDGQFGTINVASKVRVDGVSGIDGEDIADDKGGVAVSKKMTSDAFTALEGKQGKVSYLSHDGTNVEVDAIKAGDLITYTVNSAGLITSIDRPATEAEYKTAGAELKGKFVTSLPTASTLTYDANKEYFTGNGKVYVDESTVIMVVDKSIANDKLTEEDVAIVSVANLFDEQELKNAVVYNVDEDTDIAGLIFVGAEVEVVSTGAILALVSGVGEANNEDGDPIYSISALQDGLLKEGETALLTADDSVSVDTFSTILPKYNAAGEIKSAAELVTVSGKTVTFTSDIPADEPVSATNKISKKYIYGKLEGMERNGDLIVDAANNIYIEYTGETYVYIYDSGLKASNRVFMDDVAYVYYDEDDNKFFVDTDEVEVYALAREIDNEVIELVLYVIRK